MMTSNLEAGAVAELVGKIDQIAQRLDAIIERLDAGPQRFLSIGSAAAFCDVSRDTIERAIARGELSKLKPARGRVCVDRREVEAWMLGTAGVSLRKGRGIRRSRR